MGLGRFSQICIETPPPFIFSPVPSPPPPLGRRECQWTGGGTHLERGVQKKNEDGQQLSYQWTQACIDISHEPATLICPSMHAEQTCPLPTIPTNMDDCILPGESHCYARTFVFTHVQSTAYSFPAGIFVE